MNSDRWLVRAGVAAVVLVVMTIPLQAAELSSFPDQDPTSGRFVNITRGLRSLGPDETMFEIEVPAVGSFALDIFDGNSTGKWDGCSPPTATPDDVTFTLYADPLMTSAKSVAVAVWNGGAMPDDAWFAGVVANHPAALTPTGTYMYNLVVAWTGFAVANEQNNFKIRVEGQIFAPAGGTFGLVGYTPNDPSPAKFGPSTYDGSWRFHLDVIAPTSEIELWNGDFDRIDDVHDPDSPVLPPFPVSYETLAEGAFPGVPTDDAIPGSPLLVPPPIFQYLVAPGGAWTAVDVNPSGNQEWERFAVGVGGGVDVEVPSISPGRYEWIVEGADGRNTLFIHPTLNLLAEVPGAIGDYVWYDANLDGVANDGTGAGLPGVQLTLYLDANGDGVAELPLATTTTAANGTYLFPNLLAGVYEVRVNPATLPSGMTPTFDYDGTPTANLAALTLGVAQVELEIDFGYGYQGQTFGGCTPGYWKQSQHFDSWFGYSPSDMYNNVFGVSYVKTLLQALQAGGGGEKALGRHAVAALLNAANQDITFRFTQWQVIEMVQEAYRDGTFEQVKNRLAAENELGCPLN